MQHADRLAYCLCRPLSQRAGAERARSLSRRAGLDRAGSARRSSRERKPEVLVPAVAGHGSGRAAGRRGVRFGRRQRPQDRRAGRDERAGRVVGPGQQVLRRSHRPVDEREGRRRDRRREVQDRDRHHRRQERSEAGGIGRRAPDPAGRHQVHHRPERRHHGHLDPAGRREGRRDALPVCLPEIALHPARQQCGPGHDRLLPGRADHLQVPEGQEGREVDRLRRPQRVRPAEPAQRGRRSSASSWA